MKTLLACGLAIAVAGCRSGPPAPATIDTRNDACATCRMAVSSVRFASQIVAPGEEPRFFDDLGCLATYLREHGALPAGAVAFVADHRTGAWVRASDATFTLVPAVETPMGSHVIAHASAESRSADDSARGGSPVDAAEFLGAALPRGLR